MKSKFLLILTTLLVSLMMLPQGLFSQEKYYIIFDNFEDQIGNDGVQITNLFDLCYWDPLRTDVLLGKYAEKKPFNALTFAQKEITEYDVAIFVMGTTNHLGTSVDGIKVLDKIKMMVNANKGVLIIGTNVVPEAFKPGGDAQARAWLTEWLGIDNVRILGHVQGNTIYGMRVDGVEGDPISRGFQKQCNRQFAENNPELRGPIRYYSGTPFFEIKGGKNAKGFDFIKEAADQNITETWITGARAEQGKARVALWTTNFDIASTYHTNRFYNAMTWAVRWMVSDVPHPEGFLTIEDETVDFGIVEPNQSGYMQAVFMNTGRQKLTVSKFEIAGDEPDGSFRITEGGEGITMNPGDVHIVNLQFSPKEQRLYEDYLIIESDAYNGTIEAKLIGQGGEQVFNGPRLQLSSLPIDFGTVPFGQYSDKNIAISNIGNVAMVVETVTFEEDAGKRFTFAEIVKTPMTVPPGETQYVKIRFTSADEESGNYAGKINVTSNALNNLGKGSLELKARAAGLSTNSGLSLSSTSIDFGEVEVTDDDVQTLKISNIGSNVLRIFSITWDSKSGGENLAQFSFIDNTNVTKPTIEVQPGESHDLKIKFAPQAGKDYAAIIQMLTNDPVDEGLVEVPVAGKGKIPASVKDGIAKIQGLNVKISPNPVTDNSSVEYTLDVSGNLEMSIIDQTGRKVSDIYNQFTNEGLYMKELSAGNLANGVYFLSVKFNGQTVQMPFVISK
ncbi:MAG: choice-of-anchor D domain-containing protein [Candidatus Kapabacteria bacterium]|nr:choice-of-anchor D domain-containing protein [Ignavibacteriota bacterium]MCW5883689.1 choice-of-anchor D domain-containing protein [Candidatus Kapabacteria bacterium]